MDDTRLRQVLVNLVQNAVVHAPEGRITVTGRMGDGRLEIRVADHGGGATLVVRVPAT